ncbi:hypothetical protein RZS08_08085, partial [Arthrospira platensis SPKY1]|nr:hypothetical protein [Arthrospira platensis SPKY1]
MGVRVQALGPFQISARLGRQRYRLALAQLAVGGDEIVQEDAPGDAVGDQVVEDEGQAVGLSGAKVQVGDAQQGTAGEAEVGLHFGDGRFNRRLLFSRGAGLQLDVAERRARGVVFGDGVRADLDPRVAFLRKLQTQGVVMDQQRLDCGFQRLRFQRLPYLQQHRGVELLRMVVAFEEPALHRRKRRNAA